MSEENINISQEQQEQDINELIKIRIEKLKDLQEKGKDPFQIVKFDNKDNSKDIKEKFVDPVEGEEALEVVASIGGRLMSKRGHGKATFCDLQDMYGRIQIYVRLDEVGEESYEEFKKTNTKTVEGIFACEIAYEIARENNIYAPIINAIYNVIKNQSNPLDEIKKLMTSKLKSE